MPHEIVVSKQGYRPWSSKFELQSNETMKLPPVTLEPLESGFALDSVPSGATVFVDGKELDRKTPVRVAELGPGDHHIRLEAEGYAPWESSLHVTPGTVLDLPTAELIALSPDAPSQRPRPRWPRRRRTATRRNVAARPSVRRTPRAPRPSSFTPPPAVERTPAPAPSRGAELEPEPEPEPRGAGRGGRRHGHAARADAALVEGLRRRPAGRQHAAHGCRARRRQRTLTFVNDDFGIRKTVKVQIQPGQTLTQVLTLDE